MDALVRCRPCKTEMRIISRGKGTAIWWCRNCGSNIEIDTTDVRPKVILDKCVDSHTPLGDSNAR